MELPPKPYDSEEVAFNEQLLELAGGLTPPASNMRMVSIGGSHTNTFLRQVKGGSLSIVDRLAGVNGCLSFDQLKAGRPDFEEAATSGLK